MRQKLVGGSRKCPQYFLENIMQQVGSTLYKMDSRSKIRVWSVFVGEENGRNFYSVSHGQKDGQMQTSKVFVDEGKNQGRSNETTAKAQTFSEAKSLYDRQIERKGYTDVIPSAPPTLPMLAHKYADYSHKINWPAIASCKIDGCRLIIKIENNKAYCTSRTGTEMLNLDHITDELLSLNKDITIDGELYSDDLPFEEIISIVRKNKSRDPRMSQIYFYAFDIINNNTYHSRVIELDSLLVGLSNSKIVPWKVIKTEEELYSAHKKYIKEGYEGTMIRNLNSLYQPNKRSYDLLKLKEFLDYEFEITGWKTGKGKFSNVPTFSLVTEDGGVFEAVPKGDEEIRANYLNDAPNLIGKLATIRFFEYTADGIPRFPVMIGVRDYE